MMSRNIPFIYLLCFAWSGVRIGPLTIFDALSLLLCPYFLLRWNASPLKGGLNRSFMRTAFFSGILMLLGAMISAIHATDLSEHLFKGFFVSATLTITALNLALIFALDEISPKRAIIGIAMSALVHSLVGVAQGQFGLMRFIATDEWQEWTRATGLTQHPIEAGMATGVGVLCALHLGFERRRVDWVTLGYAAMLVIDLWSLAYTASLTATLSLIAAVLAYFLMSRRSVWLFALAPIALLVGASALASLQQTQLGGRLITLVTVGSDYGTVQSRAGQITIALSRLGAREILVGKSFDPATTPMGLEIHNGLIAADYYFGFLGAVSQLLLIIYSINGIFRQKWVDIKGLFLGFFLIFLPAYLTGPGMSRRSV